MKNILIVVDVQNGFVRYEQTKKNACNIKDLLKSNIFDCVIATKFINNSNSIYSKVLNWNRLISEEDRSFFDNIDNNIDIIIEKPIYTCVNTAFIQRLTQINKGKFPSYVFVVGSDTDCCVLKISTDLFENGIRPIILTNYCASNGGIESHKAGLLCLNRLIGSANLYDGDILCKEDLNSVIKKIENK